MQVVNKVFFLILVYLSCGTLYSQKNSLEEVLIEIASTHQLSIVFNPNGLPDISAATIDPAWTIDRKLKTVLRNTNLEYTIQNSEIILFKRHRIFGFIEDEKSGERLIAATLYIPSTGEYTVANEYGYYNLSTIKDSLVVIASYLGYAKKEITIQEGQMDKPKTISMSLDNTLVEVVITDALFTPQENAFLEIEKGSNILLFQNSASTAVGGEPDLFQALIRQTGVTTGADGVGGFHVRGGKSGHNQVLMDGMKIHYPNHAFGLYSVVNNSVIERASLHKSGASGPYSGSNASILDIRTKDPLLHTFSAFGQVSSVASQAGINIPLGKQIAIHAVGRTTHLDPIVLNETEKAKAANNNVGASNLFFNDFNVKLKWDIHEKLKLRGSGFYSLDGYSDTNSFLAGLEDFEGDLYEGELFQDANYTWSNNLWQIESDYILTDRTFIKASLSRYAYNYNSNFSQDFEGTNDILGRNYYEKDAGDFNSGLLSYQARIDFETALKNNSIAYGLQILHREYNLGLYSQDSIAEDENPYEPIPERPLESFFIGDRLATEATMYYVHQWKPSTKIFIEGALYYTFLHSRDKEDTFFEYNPDLLLYYGGLHGYFKGLYKWNEHIVSGFNVGSYIQTEHLLSPADNSYPNDIWIPATPVVQPQRTNQAEVFSKFIKDGHSLIVTGYLKRTAGVSLISTFPPILTLSEFLSDEWEDDIITGDLLSFGLEVSYGYQGKGWDVLANYSYGYADYQFDELNGGFPFSYDYSIPHTLSLRSQVHLSDRWSCSIDWFYANGKAFTFYDSYFRYQPLDRGIEQDVFPISGFNDYRLPDNHKLSISVSTFWKWGKSRNDLSVGIQNVYNRQNVIYAYSIDNEIEEFTGFPILPIVKYRISL